MNERIKEFWDKAAESTAAFPSGQNNSWETQVNFMEKFAELIVKECARVPINMWDKAELNADIAVKIEDRIRAEFGIPGVRI